MTIEEVRGLDMEQLEQRAAEIAKETREASEETLDALEKELTAIEERKIQIKKEAEERKAAASAVIDGEGVTVSEPEEKRGITNMEVRDSKAYIDAYANYIKTGDDAECRALLTENVTGGTIPVPSIVEGRVRTAWDRDDIMSRVSKTFIKGNVKIGFEISATGAVVHTEGSDAPAEETLVLGIVNMVPKTIKKWITVSDEAMAMAGQEFLDYIYDELTYRIAKKAAYELLDVIKNAPENNESNKDVPAVPVVAAGVAPATAIQAEALLSDEATDNVAIMNKQTYAAFKSLTTADGYLIQDPFDGMAVAFNNDLPAYSVAGDGDTYMIVGDLANGARANFPNGEEIEFIFDELSLAEKDLVKIVGKEYVALSVVAPGHFVKVQKPSA